VRIKPIIQKKKLNHNQISVEKITSAELKEAVSNVEQI
jgi:hypothetical protein